jgi:chromosome segregation ATPase
MIRKHACRDLRDALGLSPTVELTWSHLLEEVRHRRDKHVALRNEADRLESERDELESELEVLRSPLAESLHRIKTVSPERQSWYGQALEALTRRVTDLERRANQPGGPR